MIKRKANSSRCLLKEQVHTDCFSFLLLCLRPILHDMFCISLCDKNNAVFTPTLLQVKSEKKSLSCWHTAVSVPAFFFLLYWKTPACLVNTNQVACDFFFFFFLFLNKMRVGVGSMMNNNILSYKTAFLASCSFSACWANPVSRAGDRRPNMEVTHDLFSALG